MIAPGKNREHARAGAHGCRGHLKNDDDTKNSDKKMRK